MFTETGRFPAGTRLAHHWLGRPYICTLSSQFGSTELQSELHMWLHLPYVLQIAWLCSYHKVDSVDYNLEYVFQRHMQELVAEL